METYREKHESTPLRTLGPSIILLGAHCPTGTRPGFGEYPSVCGVRAYLLAAPAKQMVFEDGGMFDPDRLVSLSQTQEHRKTFAILAAERRKRSTARSTLQRDPGRDHNFGHPEHYVLLRISFMPMVARENS